MADLYDTVSVRFAYLYYSCFAFVCWLHHFPFFLLFFLTPSPSHFFLPSFPSRDWLFHKTRKEHSRPNVSFPFLPIFNFLLFPGRATRCSACLCPLEIPAVNRHAKPEMTFHPSQSDTSFHSRSSSSNIPTSLDPSQSPCPSPSPSSKSRSIYSGQSMPILVPAPTGRPLLDRIQQELNACACKRSLPNSPAPETNPPYKTVKQDKDLTSTSIPADIDTDPTCICISAQEKDKIRSIIIRKQQQIESDYQDRARATCRDTQVAYTRHVNSPANSLINTLQILFSRPGLKSLDMNSANLIDAVNLNADADEAASSISGQKRNSSLGRRYKTNFTTFTANRHGIFEVRYAYVVPTGFNLTILTFSFFGRRARGKGVIPSHTVASVRG